MENFKFDSIEDALEDFKNGKMIIVADDEDRENEGDLICSGQMVTPEIIKFMAENAKGYKSFEEWFSHIAEYTEKLKEQARQQSREKEGVVISTLHSAKGLEFDRVFIMDVNDGIIPYRKASGERDVEEERRLFYVGMTRARKELSLFYIEERHEKKMDPSRFLLESGLLERKKKL